MVVAAPGVVPVVVPVVLPLPKPKFCPRSVPDQSMPFTLEGLREVSMMRASMSTCLVAVSRLLMMAVTDSHSLSVAETTIWLVR